MLQNQNTWPFPEYKKKTAWKIFLLVTWKIFLFLLVTWKKFLSFLLLLLVVTLHVICAQY